MTKQQRQQKVLTLTMEFVDKGHDLIKARKLAKAKQLNHYIGAGRNDRAPMLHPCAGR